MDTFHRARGLLTFSKEQKESRKNVLKKFWKISQNLSKDFLITVADKRLLGKVHAYLEYSKNFEKDVEFSA